MQFCGLRWRTKIAKITAILWLAKSTAILWLEMGTKQLEVEDCYCFQKRKGNKRCVGNDEAKKKRNLTKNKENKLI